VQAEFRTSCFDFTIPHSLHRLVTCISIAASDMKGLFSFYGNTLPDAQYQDVGDDSSLIA